MPRVTKRQKEAGAQKKKRPVSGGGGGKPKGGFKVGPTNAPRNAYLGKAQRKKAELIEAAKVKQQYAKVLAKEGMHSVRVGGSVSARDRPTKRAAHAPRATDDSDGDSDGDDSDDDEGSSRKHAAARARSASDAESDSDSDSGDSSDDDDEAARFAARMRQKAREADEARARGETRGDKSKVKGKRRAEDGGSTGGGVRHGRAGPAPNERPKKRPRPVQNDTRPTARALSPPKIAPTEGRLRDLQREAFAKRHHARADGSGRGQPRMGARMDVLLEKIRRSK